MRPPRSSPIALTRSSTSANKLGVRRRPRWTRADDAKLRSLWGVEHIRTIARQLGRTVITVYYRVDVLGLQRGCPQGWEYITTAATRCGYTPAQLVRILRWAGVRVMRAQSRCLPGARRHYRIVEIGDAEDAVASWLATETVQAAGKRHGIDGQTLTRWLEDAGIRLARVKPERRGNPAWLRHHRRVESAVADRVVADRRARAQQTETMAAAARRHGVHTETMSRWLRAAGMRPTQYHWRELDPKAVDAAAARRGRQ